MADSEGKTEEYFKFELEAAIEDARAAAEAGITKENVRLLWDRVQSIKDEARKAGFIL